MDSDQIDAMAAEIEQLKAKLADAVDWMKQQCTYPCGPDREDCKCDTFIGAEALAAHGSASLAGILSHITNRALRRRSAGKLEAAAELDVLASDIRALIASQMSCASQGHDYQPAPGQDYICTICGVRDR